MIQSHCQPDARWDVEARKAVVQLDQSIRVRIGQRIQHHPLNNSEDGHIRADCKRQGQDRCYRESRASPKPAKPGDGIAQGILQYSQSRGVTNLLLDSGPIPQADGVFAFSRHFFVECEFGPPGSLSFTIVRVSADGVLRSKQAISLLQHSQSDH